MTLRISQAICAVVLSVSMVCGVSAQDAKDLSTILTLREENAKLRNRVDALESEIAGIKQMLGKPTEQKTAAPSEFTEAEVTRLKQLADSKKKPVTSGLDFELYGYVKLDAAHDSERTSVGNYSRWVESEQPGKQNNQFSMTAKETRLGLRIKGPDAGPVKTSARIEADFYGGGEAENKPVPMMRHAYMTAEWPEERFSVLAGQTSDVISPLWMPTLNYTVGWWEGNIGYRRPQIRVTKGFELAKNVEFKLEAAATRDIGRTNGFTASYSDTGQDSSIPGLQGRASLTFPGFDSKPTMVGVSGHWVEEEINHTNTFANSKSIDSWSVNLDLTVPITTWLSLTGEAYTGQDLDSYLGGIGQGYDTTLGKAIRSSGGWAAVTLKPTPKWQFNVGGGFDEVPKGDVSAAAARTFNGVIFGNAQYSFTPNFILGYEMSFLRTEYKGQDNGEDLRELLSFIYKF